MKTEHILIYSCVGDIQPPAFMIQAIEKFMKQYGDKKTIHKVEWENTSYSQDVHIVSYAIYYND